MIDWRFYVGRVPITMRVTRGILRYLHEPPGRTNYLSPLEVKEARRIRREFLENEIRQHQGLPPIDHHAVQVDRRKF